MNVDYNLSRTVIKIVKFGKGLCKNEKLFKEKKITEDPNVSGRIR